MPNLSDDDRKSNEKPALTINIQSWATPVIGLVMLVLGLAAGYWGRPLLGQPEKEQVTVQETSPATPMVAITPTIAPAATADLQELMTYVVGQTRHFRGDANAPVTIIEFSDFQ